MNRHVTMLRRWAGWVSGVWGGLLLGVGFIGAPAGFAVTTAEVAGRSAGRMFAVEAYVSLAVAVIVLILTRRSASKTRARTISAISTSTILHIPLQPTLRNWPRRVVKPRPMR